MLGSLIRLIRPTRTVPVTPTILDQDNPYPAMFRAQRKELTTQIDHLARVIDSHETAVILNVGIGRLNRAQIDAACSTLGLRLEELRAFDAWIATL
jgi:hypothetical protein